MRRSPQPNLIQENPNIQPFRQVPRYWLPFRQGSAEDLEALRQRLQQMEDRYAQGQIQPLQDPKPLPIQKSPIQKDPIQQPPVQIDYQKIIDMMAADGRFRGRDGTNGTNGQDGAPGQITEQQLRQIVQAVASQMPQPPNISELEQRLSNLEQAPIRLKVNGTSSTIRLGERNASGDFKSLNIRPK